MEAKQKQRNYFWILDQALANGQWLIVKELKRQVLHEEEDKEFRDMVNTMVHKGEKKNKINNVTPLHLLDCGASETIEQISSGIGMEDPLHQPILWYSRRGTYENSASPNIPPEGSVDEWTEEWAKRGLFQFTYLYVMDLFHADQHSAAINILTSYLNRVKGDIFALRLGVEILRKIDERSNELLEYAKRLNKADPDSDLALTVLWRFCVHQQIKKDEMVLYLVNRLSLNLASPSRYLQLWKHIQFFCDYRDIDEFRNQKEKSSKTFNNMVWMETHYPFLFTDFKTDEEKECYETNETKELIFLKYFALEMFFAPNENYCQRMSEIFDLETDVHKKPVKKTIKKISEDRCEEGFIYKLQKEPKWSQTLSRADDYKPISPFPLKIAPKSTHGIFYGTAKAELVNHDGNDLKNHRAQLDQQVQDEYVSAHTIQLNDNKGANFTLAIRNCQDGSKFRIKFTIKWRSNEGFFKQTILTDPFCVSVKKMDSLKRI
eukprot:TRINITY_DN5953_c0_g1_i1.p1 TRINITY_DN5953_c0_g1~~TRINITY_DN5953_c0_g1_i1.p1  ORF type:complete len:490 (-),score=115.56 TRINITY_DN5953_c0_g1_i1:51-1520(-)